MPDLILVRWLLICVAWLACGPLSTSAAEPQQPKRVAAIVTSYFHNSHADVLVSRLLETDTLDGKGPIVPLKLASLYVDQFSPRDVGRRLAAKHNFPIYPTITEALTLGTGKLAVDGVLLVAEHGEYPISATGQSVYPKRRFFEEILKVFDASGRVVPVFSDKHLADNWQDAQWIYESARKRQIPLMAGSSLPTAIRRPGIDVPRDAKLDEIVGISYGPVEGYGYHALEVLQCLVERRGGEQRGVRSVQAISGAKVWEAQRAGLFDGEVFAAAQARQDRQPPGGKPLEELITKPVLFVIEYQDGLRASILHASDLYADWSFAWRYQGDRRIESTLFWTQELRPFTHFSYLLSGVEKMINSGKPSWPVERTLTTTGMLHGLMLSLHEGGKKIVTPHLEFNYTSEWNWQQQPTPPPGRPLDGE